MRCHFSRNKKLIQDAVVGSSSGAPNEAGAARPNEVVSLLLGEDELEEGLRMAELKRKRAEEKQIEDGRRGAKTRELNKAQLKLEKALAAEEAAKKLAAGSLWQADDDEGESRSLPFVSLVAAFLTFFLDLFCCLRCLFVLYQSYECCDG